MLAILQEELMMEAWETLDMESKYTMSTADWSAMHTGLAPPPDLTVTLYAEETGVQTSHAQVHLVDRPLLIVPKCPAALNLSNLT